MKFILEIPGPGPGGGREGIPSLSPDARGNDVSAKSAAAVMTIVQTRLGGSGLSKGNGALLRPFPKPTAAPGLSRNRSLTPAIYLSIQYTSLETLP